MSNAVDLSVRACRDVPSPVGPLRLWADPEALTAIEFHPFAETPPGDPAPVAGGGAEELLTEAERQLAAYFAGERHDFDLPLAPAGTPFQQRVWGALREIPYGETRSYGQVARTLGLVPGASRAVGLANGRNPIPVVVPCHRVIGADGTLTGYAGGLERKRTLLGLEQRTLF